MHGIFFRVSRFDLTFAEFADRDEAIDYAKRKARNLRGAFTVNVQKIEPEPRAEAVASFRSNKRGSLS